jgi:hypothetical protein
MIAPSRSWWINVPSLMKAASEELMSCSPGNAELLWRGCRAAVRNGYEPASAVRSRSGSR